MGEAGGHRLTYPSPIQRPLALSKVIPQILTAFAFRARYSDMPEGMHYCPGVRSTIAVCMPDVSALFAQHNSAVDADLLHSCWLTRVADSPRLHGLPMNGTQTELLCFKLHVVSRLQNYMGRWRSS